MEFRFPEEAKKAQVAFAGRKYNGRMLVSGFFNESRYLTKNFIRDDDEERAVAEKYKPKSESGNEENSEIFTTTTTTAPNQPIASTRLDNVD